MKKRFSILAFFLNKIYSFSILSPHFDLKKIFLNNQIKKNKAIEWLSQLNKIYSKEIPILLKFNWFSEIDDYSELHLLDDFFVSFK